MRKVVVESPYAGNIEQNTTYARRAVRDCLLKQEAPFASHLLYTQPGILDDSVKQERDLGIEAGLVIANGFNASVVYTDYGVSFGMKLGIDRAIKESRIIEYRSIGKNPIG